MPLDRIIVLAPSIPHFKGLGMRNLQHEIRICQKSHNTATNQNYILCAVLIFMNQTLHNLFSRVLKKWKKKKEEITDKKCVVLIFLF
jgi:hypothetical protein